MIAADHKEDIISLIPALKQLLNVGYGYVGSREAVELRGGKLNQAVLTGLLRKQLYAINSIPFRGEEYSFSDSNIEKAVQALRDIPFDGLITTNEQVYDLLTLGKSFEQKIQGYTKSFSLRYIDWENPENNVFHVCDEFVIEKMHSKQTRRPDIVLFVNGIPLVVIEAKRPDKPNSIREGISQHIRNQGVDEIPHLFVYSQLLLSIAQNQAVYASTDTPAKFWCTWKEEYSPDDEAVLRQSINKKLNADTLRTVFSDRDDWQKRKMQEIWNAGDRIPSVQDKTIFSLLRPERLLEMTHSFVIFDAKVKKVARYQQYFAVKETLARITRVKGDARRPGGLIWHTTGTGKSITMVLLAKAISLEPSIIDPTIVLVTDRVDLDDQIYKTFKNCGKEVEKAASGEGLFRLIEESKVNIISTIIDKFEAGLRKNKLRSSGRNIFLLVDESHRSQYGNAHTSMTRVFPNACYIGFTGTPLLKKEKSTAEKFGGFIHTYTMNQAISDGVITPLVYEGRMSELRGDREKIDRWFDRITVDLSEKQKLDLKRKFRREEEINSSEDRLKEIAYDIIQHFKQFKGAGIKGQFAVSSKRDAVRYKNHFSNFGGISTEVIMSPPDTREDHSEVDEAEIPEVQRFWKSMMDTFGSPKTYQDTIIRRFKGEGAPELLIVIDKLLTGFDAPRNTVLYIDKRLKEHGIIQAISRVNRLYEGKEHGLIIDYRGVFKKLNEAIELYAALEAEGFEIKDIEGTFTDVLLEIATLSECHTNLWAVFNGVKNKSDIEAMQLHLEPENIWEKFYEALGMYLRVLRLALNNALFHDRTDEKVKQRYKDDMLFFVNLMNMVKLRYNETVNYSAYEVQIRNMVGTYIGADKVEQIVEPIDIFNANNLERELHGIEGDAAQADAIASRVRKRINEKMQEDPLFYKSLSEVITEAIADHRARRLSDADYLNTMRKVVDDIQSGGSEGIPESLNKNKDAKPFYRIISTELPREQVGEAAPAFVASNAAVRVHGIIEELKKRDWVTDGAVDKQMRNAIEDYLYHLEKRYGMKLSYEAIDRIIKQSLDVARARETYG